MKETVEAKVISQFTMDIPQWIREDVCSDHDLIEVHATILPTEVRMYIAYADKGSATRYGGSDITIKDPSDLAVFYDLIRQYAEYSVEDVYSSMSVFLHKVFTLQSAMQSHKDA